MKAKKSCIKFGDIGLFEQPTEKTCSSQKMQLFTYKKDKTLKALSL